MIVATARVVLDYFGNTSLSKKRKDLEAFSDGLRRKFNISVLEIGTSRDPENCSMGVASVAPDEAAAQKQMEDILKYIDQNSFARVIFEDVEFFSHESNHRK